MRNSSGTLLGTQVWAPRDLGGLGYVTGMSIAADGSWMLARTDVGGVYRRASTATAWTQVVSSLSMTLPDPLTANGNRFGCFEQAIAPSDATVAYIAFRSRILRSADSGVSWADDNLNGTTGLYMGSNDQTAGVVRLVANKLTVDPSNSAVVYFGSQATAPWGRSGGVWAQIASLPASSLANAARVTIFTIDSTSSLVGSGPTSRRSIVYASVSGQGVYQSTDGGTTFALMSGHPGAGAAYEAWFLNYDATLGKLILCLKNGSGSNVWTWNGTAWTNLTMTGITTVVRSLRYDPKTAGRIVGQAETGCPIRSLDGGTTWKLWNTVNQFSVSTDVSIIATVLNSTFGGGASASFADIIPHPVEAYDYVPMGLGVCRFAVPWPTLPSTTDKLIWRESAAGQEELVANYIHITANGTPIVGSQDKSLIRLPTTGYPPSSYPPSILRVGYGISSAIDDPTYIVGISNLETAFSINDGRDWASFSSALFTKLGGGIAVGNKPNVVRFQGQNGWPAYTLDGVTWATPTFTGYTMPAEGAGNGWGFGSSNTRRHIVCADKANPGTFYAYNSTDISGTSRGIWKSTNGGAVWARVNTTSIINPLFVGFHNQLTMDRGILYLCPGESGDSYNGDTVNLTYRSEDGGVTWTALGELYEINLLAIGAPAPDSGLHTLYALGWKTISGAPTFGMYRSLNKGANWTLLTNNPTFDHAYAMAADPSTFGRVIAGYTGTGYAETNYDYTMLLKGS